MAGEWFREQLGWKVASTKASSRCQKFFGEAIGPNLADLSNTASTLIAGRTYELLGIPKSKIVTFHIADLEGDDETDHDASAEATGKVVKPAQGTVLERGLENDLVASLDPNYYTVSRTTPIHHYVQYQHLARWQKAIDQDPGLRIYAAGDYAVETDVLIGVRDPASATGDELLHAAVSSKLTLRSDRAQNVRTEFNVLVRNRRGRTPHLVVVTAEPHPGRLISLTRGTGEIDATYHLLFHEMDQAIKELAARRDLHGATETSLSRQAGRWAEMVEGRRLRPYTELASVLSST